MTPVGYNQSKQGTVQLVPGDAVVFYPDGVTDAEDRTGMFFSQERLLAVVEANRGRSVQDVQAALLEVRIEIEKEEVQRD